MSTARWRLLTADVPIARIRVMQVGDSFDVLLGEMALRVETEQHWADINEAVTGCFSALPAPRQIPLPRTDAVKPTDYLSVNCSGACWGEDE